MRYLVLSDIHGNLAALEAVLSRVRRKRFDAVLMLGDVVGYGASPNQVVEALRELKPDMPRIRGNHDKVVVGAESDSAFNEVARAAARWTREKLTHANRTWLSDLPRGPVEVEPDLVICHGSPIDEDMYLFSDFDAHQVFAADPQRLTFFGHTHVPSAFVSGPEGLEVEALRDEGRLELEPGRKYLLNPGSIGQPRDRDPRAAYMIYDSDKGAVRWYRLEYDVGAAQERIRRAGLPEVLAERLEVGA